MSDSTDSERAAAEAVTSIVRSLLTTAGLKLTEEQIAGFVRVYPTLRAQADRLFAIPEIRYEEPAITFSATTD